MLKKSHFKRVRNLLENSSEKPAESREKGGTPSVPERLCIRCPSCKGVFFRTEVEENAQVCPACEYHFRLPARQRIALMCDADSFLEWDAQLTATDPLGFPGYAEKLKKSRLASGSAEAVLCGQAAIGGVALAVFAMEGDFMMGSMGSAVGEKITRLFERAAAQRLPVVGFTVSGGARMQEGALSLMQMAKTSGAVKRHSDAGLLYIAVLTDPTTGGVTASFAMEGDILLAEPGALIAFAGPRVIEQTIRQKLPKNFQRAEYLLEHGFLDAVTHRRRLKKVLAYLLRLHTPQVNNEPEAGESGYGNGIRDSHTGARGGASIGQEHGEEPV